MWTSTTDVRSRWTDGGVPVDDVALAVLIGDAEDALTVAVPGVADLIESGAIPRERVSRVVARIVIRFLRNPSGIRTVQETTGQFSGSTTYAGDSLGEIVVTDADRRELLGKGARVRRAAFSVLPGGIQ